MRPPSIVMFSRLFLAALGIGLVNSALNWQASVDQMAAAGDVLPAWVLPATLVVGLAINLLLWWLVAHRGSTVAKWILTVFLGLGLLGFVLAMAQGTFPAGLQGVIGIVTFVLQAIAIGMLFRPDARRWFAGDRDLGETFS